jgi:hypothetical protein
MNCKAQTIKYYKLPAVRLEKKNEALDFNQPIGIGAYVHRASGVVHKHKPYHPINHTQLGQLQRNQDARTKQMETLSHE